MTASEKYSPDGGQSSMSESGSDPTLGGVAPISMGCRPDASSHLFAAILAAPGRPTVEAGHPILGGSSLTLEDTRGGGDDGMLGL